MFDNHNNVKSILKNHNLMSVIACDSSEKNFDWIPRVKNSIRLVISEKISMDIWKDINDLQVRFLFCSIHFFLLICCQLSRTKFTTYPFPAKFPGSGFEPNHVTDLWKYINKGQVRPRWSKLSIRSTRSALAWGGYLKGK